MTDQSSRSITVIDSPPTLALAGPDAAEPALLYLATLHTDRSRQTAVEALRRIARVLRLGEDADAWKRLPWATLRARETTYVKRVLVETYSPSTARLTMSILRGVLKQAWRMGLLTADEWLRAKDTGAVKGESAPAGRMLSSDELGRLDGYLAALRGAYGDMARAMFACGLGGGLRREEIVKLRVSSLADDHQHLLVAGKGRKERVQALPTGAGKAVAQWIETRATLGLKSETLFVDARLDDVTDLPISVWGVWRLVRRVGKAAGIAHFTPHDLRRTFASRMLDASDLPTVQGLMGHAKPTTTALYDRRGKKKQREVVDRAGWSPTLPERGSGTPSYIRNGKAVTASWIRGQVAAVRKMGCNDARILRVFHGAGVRRGDGASLGAEDLGS